MSKIQKECFLRKYKNLDKVFNTNKDLSFEHIVNFSQTKNLPITNWFYFQEGYSPKLVMKVLEKINLTNGNLTIFDPFVGSGTTLLTAKQLGFKSSGFEINPFSCFIAKIKTQNYTNVNLEQLKNFELPNLKTVPNVYEKYELKIIRNLFNKEKLEKIELLKEKIRKIEDEKTRELLFGALLSILEDSSNYRKGGNGLKRKTVMKNNDPFELFKNKITQIIVDLENTKNGPEPTIINDSCLNIRKYKIPTLDASVFSPPYANCFDPFEVYKMELWIGEFVKSYEELRKMRKFSIASNLRVNLNRKIENAHRTELLENILSFLSEQKLWSNRIPRMLDLYFSDMYKLLRILYNLTKKDGYCVIVVGNSSYGNLVVPVDLILADISKDIGFNVKEIIVARKNETSSQQHTKLGNLLEYLRESIVVLKK